MQLLDWCHLPSHCAGTASKRWSPHHRYGGMLIGPALLLGLGLTSKPDTSWVKWARKEARRELKQEGVL